uniref:Calcineurin-like phosphoesterase domain-containing protein n=1 Tax=Paramoeba aestuarina TaxID=180227 RepID=A0A7S4KM03_9EUKA
MEEAFSFGVFADIQYAMKEDKPPKYYKSSLSFFENCVRDLNGPKGENLSFTIQLGDLIDGNETVELTEKDLTTIMDPLSRLPRENRPHYDVLGNHCLRYPRTKLCKILNFPNGRSYFSFQVKNWNFIILDHQYHSSEIADEEDKTYQKRKEKGQEILEKLKLTEVPNAVTWNGALGEEQLSWFKNEVETSEKDGKSVGIFSHIPLLREAGSNRHVAWDHAEVLEVLDASNCVEFYMAGHYHEGGYHYRNNVHHITMEGMLQNDPQNETSYSIISVNDNKLTIEGIGNCTSRDLELRKK